MTGARRRGLFFSKQDEPWTREEALVRTLCDQITFTIRLDNFGMTAMGKHLVVIGDAEVHRQIAFSLQQLRQGRNPHDVPPLRPSPARVSAEGGR